MIFLYYFGIFFMVNSKHLIEYLTKKIMHGSKNLPLTLNFFVQTQLKFYTIIFYYQYLDERRQKKKTDIISKN